MVKYIIFSDEELERLVNGLAVPVTNEDGSRIVYMNEDSYAKILKAQQNEVTVKTYVKEKV